MADDSKPLLSVKHLREGGFGMAMAKGGPYKATQTLEWQIVDKSGATVGVLSNETAANLVNRLAELYQILLDANALSHLKARFDFGYMDIPVDMYRRLEKLLTPTPISSPQ
jgi:hypothetical protein